MVLMQNNRICIKQRGLDLGLETWLSFTMHTRVAANCKAFQNLQVFKVGGGGGLFALSFKLQQDLPV